MPPGLVVERREHLYGRVVLWELPRAAKLKEHPATIDG
jgi:hypothetical protein